jgi:hypothetical protein
MYKHRSKSPRIRTQIKQTRIKVNEQVNIKVNKAKTKNQFTITSRILSAPKELPQNQGRKTDVHEIPDQGIL